MNICVPDHRKSCAACCGLYNVADATRPELFAKLLRRTELFRSTPRDADSICAYKDETALLESNEPLEEIIHVCEFTGFLDDDQRLVGCMLHPSAVGNHGLDLRGLCHYGSMACKAFYCPAWRELSPAQRDLVAEAIDDWHLYGLVMTDVEFVQAVTGLIEKSAGKTLTSALQRDDPCAKALKDMLSWKDNENLAGGSGLRRSRYYFGAPEEQDRPASCNHEQELLDCLRFTYGADFDECVARELIARSTESLCRAT